MKWHLLSKWLLLSMAAVAALAVGPASAADMPLKAPPGAIGPNNWSGLYIGGHGGLSYGTTQSIDQDTGSAITDKYNPVGLLLGGSIGLNRQFGNIVIGAEGDIALTAMKDTTHDISPFNTAFFEQFDQRWIATYRGRLGVVLGSQGQSMIYGTAGGASASIKIAVNSGGGAQIAETRTLNGWTAGGGFETLLSLHWSLRSEILYVRFDDKTYFTPSPSVTFLSNRIVQTDQIIGRIGLSYRFSPMGW
jgi:outer membrane immunogenic protein